MPIEVDPKTIHDAIQGDRFALGKVLEASQDLIYNVCFRMLGDANDASETTQDTMVKIIEHIAEFQGQSELSTWITRIAMNQSISRIRKRKLRRTKSLDDTGPAGGDGEESQTLGGKLPDDRELSPLDRVEQKEELVRLRAAMARIDEEYRAVLVLRDLQDMDYQEIGRTLDIPVGTVKSRLFRARAALREEMTKTEPSAATDPTADDQ